MYQIANSTSGDKTKLTASGYSFSSKYQGLIDEKLTKMIRNLIASLILYLDTFMKQYYLLHEVVSIFRMIQVIGPTFMPQLSSFWVAGSRSHNAITLLSYVFCFISHENRYKLSVAIMFSFSGVFFTFVILSIFSSLYYQKHGKLPTILSEFITLFINTGGYLLPPIAMLVMGETLSLIVNKKPTAFSYTTEIFAIITAFVVFLFYFRFVFVTYSTAFVFRPTSLLSVNPSSQLSLFVGSCFVSLYSGFMSEFPQQKVSFLCFLGAFLFILCLIALIIRVSLVSFFHRKLAFGAMTGGCLNFLFVGILTNSNIQANNTLLFIMIGIIILSYMISHIYVERQIIKSLLFLDMLMDDPTTMERVHGTFSFMNHVIIGMSYAHPVCIDWSLLKLGSEKWPDSSLVWSIFGKFVAIYPEEANLHSFVIHNISSRHIKGMIAKQTIAQSVLIMQQRESNLTAYLKHKLEKVSRQVSSAKRKLRRVWDQVIQGNIREMESCVNSAFNSVSSCETEFNLLLTQFPNNRFVARSYAHFLYEVRADFEGNQIWADKIRHMQRGMQVHSDRTQELGLHAFPALPSVVSKGIQIIPPMESESQITEQDIDEEQLTIKKEEASTIRELINNISIPSVFCISFTTTAFFVFILLGSLLPLSLSFSLTENLSKPLDLLYRLSFLYSMNYMLPTFAHRHILENFPSNGSILTSPSYINTSFQFFGYENTTMGQLSFIAKEMSQVIGGIEEFRSYRKGNPTFDNIRKELFGSTITYYSYISPDFPYQYNTSIHGFVLDFVANILKISGTTNFSSSIFNSIELLNPLRNSEIVGNRIREFIRMVEFFMDEKNSTLYETLQTFSYGSSVLLVLLMIIILYFEVSVLNSNKNAIYRCMMALPKNIVSSVVEGLRTIKKDDPDTSKNTEADSEVSRQEENIIKIFASASDANYNDVSNSTFIVVGNIVLLLCCIIIFSTGFNLFQEQSSVLASVSPHFLNVLGSSSYLVSTYLTINDLVATSQGYNTSNYSVLEIAQNVPKHLDNFINSLNYARFGGKNVNQRPYADFSDLLSEARTKLNYSDITLKPKKSRDIYDCFSPDAQFRLIHPLTHRIVDPFINGSSPAPDGSNPYINEGWYMAIVSFWNSYFFPVFDSIMENTNKNIDNLFPPALLIIIILIISSFLSFLFIVYSNFQNRNNMLFALHLLLNCPVQTVLSNPKIMLVLSGDFDNSEVDQATRDSEFYNNIVQDLPDSVIVADSNMMIVSTNKMTDSIFQVQSSTIKGTSIKEFFNQEKFSSDLSSLFNPHNKTISVNSEYTKPNGDRLHLSISSNIISSNIVITTRNISQTVYYNRLIAEEKGKSDKLLMSILPASLVPRVQADEKNISFAVQSASIVFIDIVGFTPWCAENTAAMVMQTLSTLFREFDSIVATLPVMSKIKCIGDCYMAAGGIFSEVSQPGQNAKEAVEFGLQAIQAVQKVNELLQISLKIRVGVNVGGPIVAGVLGTEKPTFEVLGPAINMAQQMEHHGIPMSVHISRSVYELIYGGSFNIQERGQISIKNGSVLSYLVN